MELDLTFKVKLINCLFAFLSFVWLGCLFSSEVISEFKEKIGQLKKEIKELDRSEKAEKEMRIAELQLSKAKKVLDHGPDPISRPKRKWFQTNQEKNQERGKFTTTLMI